MWIQESCQTVSASFSFYLFNLTTYYFPIYVVVSTDAISAVVLSEVDGIIITKGEHEVALKAFLTGQQGSASLWTGSG